MVRDTLARVGIFAFAFAMAIPFVGPSHPRDLGSVEVAAAFDSVSVQGIARGPRRVRDQVQPEMVAGVEQAPELAAAPTPEATPEPTPEPTTSPQPAAVVKTPPPAAALPTLPDPPTSGVILASWYGPGFYGNRTACGQAYSPQIVGVAHRTLPCGTLLTLSYGGRSLTVPVIDRGPYIAGRTLDLSNATRLALGCPDLCTLSMRIAP
jgi:rare lipoprotein A (RlpA)-like double-psi beta-barrel protein